MTKNKYRVAAKHYKTGSFQIVDVIDFDSRFEAEKFIAAMNEQAGVPMENFTIIPEVE